MVLDPFSALSIATGVVQFLDFGRKLVTESYDLYRAADGGSAKQRLLKPVAERLRSEAHRLEQSARVGSWQYQTEDEGALQQLAASCQETTQEFMTMMEDLQVDRGASGWDKGAQTLRQALRGMRKEKHLDKFEQQLNIYRSELTLRVASSLQYVLHFVC